MKILYKSIDEEISEEPSEKDSDIYNKVNILITKSVNEQEEYREELNNILKATNYVIAEQNAYKIPYKQKDNKYTNFLRNFKYFYEKATNSKVKEVCFVFPEEPTKNLYLTLDDEEIQLVKEKFDNAIKSINITKA